MVFMDLFFLTQYGHLWLFWILLFGIIALPGVDMAFVLGSTMAGGRKLGEAALSGIVAGGAMHSLMAYFGIGVALQSIPGVFTAVLVLGALFLAWVGLEIFRGASALTNVKATTNLSAGKAFSHALVICLLNPKAYLFMLAIYPQFVRSEYGSLVGQILILGGLVAITQIAVYGAVSLSAAWLGRSLSEHAKLQVLMGQVFGIFMIATAVWSLINAVTN